MLSEIRTSFFKVKLNAILLGVSVSVVISIVLMAVAAMFIDNEYIDLSHIRYAVWIIHFIAIFLGTTISGKIFGPNILTNAICIPVVYSLLYIAATVALIDGVKKTSILLFIISIVSGFISVLTDYALLNKSTKSRKRKRSW